MVTQMNHHFIGKTSSETLKDLIDLFIRGRPFDSWGGGGYGFFVKKRLFNKFWKINSLFSYLWEKNSFFMKL